MQPPKPFKWHQEDACLLKCTACQTIVSADVCDLHTCEGMA